MDRLFGMATRGFRPYVLAFFGVLLIRYLLQLLNWSGVQGDKFDEVVFDNVSHTQYLSDNLAIRLRAIFSTHCLNTGIKMKCFSRSSTFKI